MKTIWTSQWPTEPGMYWFYGQRYGIGEARLSLVEASCSMTGMNYMCRGGFFTPKEATGVFAPIALPTLP